MKPTHAQPFLQTKGYLSSSAGNGISISDREGNDCVQWRRRKDLPSLRAPNDEVLSCSITSMHPIYVVTGHFFLHLSDLISIEFRNNDG
jgi:hypothetical protein